MTYSHLIKQFFKLRHHTTKTPQAIQALQKEKLQAILLHAFDHSHYYRKSFEEAGITRESIGQLPLSAFPTIDKRTLLEHFDTLVTVPGVTQDALRAFDEEVSQTQEKFQGLYHSVHSSGSTGKPGYFIYDDAAWQEMLVGIIRGALWDMKLMDIVKLFVKRPRIVYMAATDGRYGGAMAVGGGIEGLHMEQLYLDIKTPLAEWLLAIKQFKPQIIIGYPSAIKILAEAVEEGKVAVAISRVITCGEPLGPSLRHYMEDIFQAPVINIYGASESLALGVEAKAQDGMYLFDDLNMIEIESNHIYLTCLYNKVQPLIRYKLSDQLITKIKPQPSPYPFTQVDRILGRHEDLLWFEDAYGTREFLHPLAIEGFCIEGLVDYQFIQHQRDALEMLAEVPDERKRPYVYEKMQEAMQRLLKEKRLTYVAFTIRFTKQIGADVQTGKKRLIQRRYTDEEKHTLSERCL